MSEEIVISGISGRFPNCDNVEELKSALFSGIDLITEDERRFPPGTLNTPKKTGKINDIDKFDTHFFGISYKQSDFTSQRKRILLETVFEAIIDAGINPRELRGSKTAVIISCGPTDAISVIAKHPDINGYCNIGYNPSTAANRTSFCFDLKGPSFALEGDYPGGFFALETAKNLIEKGECDNAVLATMQINLNPWDFIELKKLNLLSNDGKTKVFGKNRDGYARSEAIVALLVQKKRFARRSYATVMGCCGLSGRYDEMRKHLEKFYKAKGINIEDINYLEASSSGLKIDDAEECRIISELFGQRITPLLIGSIKSNIGHTEYSSCFCSLIKIILAMETEIIPANLHCELDRNLPGISTGKLKVVQKNTPWKTDVAATNSFGLTNVCSHVILKRNSKKKEQQKPSHYRLVLVSGRSMTAVESYLQSIENYKNDGEFLALIDEIHKLNIDGYNYRGYAIFGEKTIKEIDKSNYDSRPLWFVYTGMGSQWPLMGRDLMKFEPFKKTIQKCADALKPYGIDLIDVITNETKETFDNILNAFISIAATEIALTDVLKNFGLEPDGYFGHSLGEVGCAYASGLAPEEAIMLAYARGYASISSNLPRGKMAAVGLNKEECLKILPPNTTIACYNNSQSLTISGPEEEVNNLVNNLNSKRIFAKLVNSGNCAFHSKYIAAAGPVVYNIIKNVITKPKLRSKKWISTSIPENQWNSDLAKYNSAEYHVHNLLNPVLFDQAYKHVPNNAIVVEVSPHGLLQAILKREFPSTVTNISLTNKSAHDNLIFFLSAIGKIYLNGGQPDLRKIYDSDITYPVSRATPMIGPLIKWDHSTSFIVPYVKSDTEFGVATGIDISKNADNFYKGHNIDGRILIPATGYLVLVWQMFADMHMKLIENLPIIFEKVKFNRAAVLNYTDMSFLLINIQKSGYFEIYESGISIVTGYIRTSANIDEEFINPSFPTLNSNAIMTKKEIYKEFHLRRYMYEELFQGIIESSLDGSKGKLEWNNNWVTFLDTMMQITIFQGYQRSIFLPTFVSKIVIDPLKHLSSVNENKEIPVYYNKYLNLVKSGGVEIIDLQTTKAPKKQKCQSDPVLLTYEFIPYENVIEEKIDIIKQLKIVLQIVSENSNQEIKISSATPNQLPLKEVIQKEVFVTITEEEYEEKSDNKYDLLIVTKITKPFENISKSIKDWGFILYIGNEEAVISDNLTIIYKRTSNDQRLILLRKIENIPKKFITLNVNMNDLGWIKILQKCIANDNTALIYLISNEKCSGLMGFLKSLLREIGSSQIRGFLIEDSNAKPFDVNSQFYNKQLNKNLTFNILKNNQWGSYRHLLLSEIKQKQVKYASCMSMSLGDLSSIKWVERPSDFHEHVIQKDIAIHYSALNFKDVLIATGKLLANERSDPTGADFSIGFEFSGISKNGDRVMGINDGGSINLWAENICNDFLWPIPSNWTLEDAATVPTVYATAYYALIDRGNLKTRESILIHAGSGGVGLAAIAIALSLKCQVFTTVSTPEKKQFLKNFFPNINEINIGNSRDETFEDLIMSKTNGKGVDVILNSLADNLFQTTIRCLGYGGRFLEIGKVDLVNDSKINSQIFIKNGSFHGILLDDLINKAGPVRKKIFHLVLDGIQRGVVRPLPRHVFEKYQLEDAFRFLSTGKHMGKVIIKVRDTVDQISSDVSIKAIRRTYFHSSKSYIIVGGMGGFGLELTSWLIERGAKYIILNTRRKQLNGYQHYCLKKFKNLQATVEISTDDSTTLPGAEDLLKKAKKMGPVGGIFNLALVLRDALFENQTVANFKEVFNSKIVSGRNLDKVSRKRCRDLDYFVVFSSIVAGFGNAGQTNYGMANSALERLCELRRKDGLPAHAIQWGAIADVGVLEKVDKANLSFFGTIPQNVTSCLAALDQFLLGPNTVCTSVVLENKEKKGNTIGKSPADAIANILGIRQIDEIDIDTELLNLGLDSLMTTEIRQILYKNYEIELNVEEIRILTFRKILELEGTRSLSTQNKNDVSIIPTETLVPLNHNESKNIVFFIHPLEGHVKALEELAKKLNASVYGLQCTNDIPCDSVLEHAQCFIKEIKTIQNEGPYMLCGYSYGTSVVFEMALQLQKANEKCFVAFLDGSPRAINKSFSKGLQKYLTEKEQRASNLKRFLEVFFDVSNEKLNQIFDNGSSLEEALESFSNSLAKGTIHRSDDIKTAALNYYKRFQAGANYKPKMKFKGPSVLIKASINDFKTTEKDYELSQDCEQFSMFELEGDHQSILQGNNANKIAKMLTEFFNL